MFLACFVNHGNSWINLEATTHYLKLHVDELTLKGHKCDQTRHHRHQNSSVGADETTTGNEERDILLTLLDHRTLGTGGPIESVPLVS